MFVPQLPRVRTIWNGSLYCVNTCLVTLLRGNFGWTTIIYAEIRIVRGQRNLSSDWTVQGDFDVVKMERVEEMIGLVAK